MRYNLATVSATQAVIRWRIFYPDVGDYRFESGRL